MKNIRTLPLRASFTTLLLAACFGKAVSQAIEATLFFQDTTTRTVELDERAFTRLNTLRLQSTGEVIPLLDVTRVQANGKVYEPKPVAMYLFFQMMDISDLDVQKVDTVLLLQKMRGGTLSLYLFTDQTTRNHWFAEKDNRIQELIQVEYMKEGQIGRQDRYKGILNLFTSDCAAVGKNYIEKLDFNKYAFEKVVDRYNQACGTGEYESPKRKWDFNIGVMAGSYHYKSAFKPGAFYRYDFPYNKLGAGMKSTSGNAMLIGIFAKFPVFGQSSNLSIVLNLHYSSSLSFKYDHEEVSSIEDTVFVKAVLKATYVNTEIAIRYDLPFYNTKLNPFIESGAGFRNTWKIKQNSLIEDRYKRPNWARHYETVAITKYDKPKNLVYYHLRLGIVYKHFELGVSYKSGMGGITNLKDIERQNSVGVDLRFAVF
jgi:hypothetical protein